MLVIDDYLNLLSWDVESLFLELVGLKKIELLIIVNILYCVEWVEYFLL